jgi:hypothetical protein
MITTQELISATNIVKDVVVSMGYNRIKSMQVITDMCNQDNNMQVLFAKVGLELFNSSNAVKH